jgi:phytoene desaturase
MYYPVGGIYAIARAYSRLAQDLGVEIRTNCCVSAIKVQDGCVVGVELETGGFQPAAAVVANLDVGLVYEHLLSRVEIAKRRLTKLEKMELSCSAFVLMLGIRGQRPELAHHNTFFSSDYQREFDDIFLHRRPPTEPTIYLAITSKATPEDAPYECENWFIQVNVPPVDSAWDWSARAQEYGDKILAQLARRGWDIRGDIQVRHSLTPLDFERMTAARKGSLYGSSSNSRWAAFRRPHNRAAKIKGLYFAGGTAHPGGGVPMATLSGKIASTLMLEDGF